ncbi:hypothetical protein [Kitasatospora purpeofusca]|uniref:hypothetical protein n=1 Tax=Kitasatospora purpeofusca TaxID=67352 RepID=UPI0036BD5473
MSRNRHLGGSVGTGMGGARAGRVVPDEATRSAERLAARQMERAWRTAHPEAMRDLDRLTAQREADQAAVHAAEMAERITGSVAARLRGAIEARFDRQRLEVFGRMKP